MKLSNSQFKKLKTATKNRYGITLKILINMIGHAGDINFPHKSLLTKTQVANISKSFANNEFSDIKLSKTLVPKIFRLVGFLSKLGILILDYH